MLDMGLESLAEMIERTTKIDRTEGFDDFYACVGIEMDAPHSSVLLLS